MNEPVIGGAQSDRDWLAGEPLGGKHFVQRIALQTGERQREDIARDWVDTLTTAIRQEDPERLITVGVIPWAHVWPNAKPVFYAPSVAEHLDFVSVHFYPETGKLDGALAALRVYDIGKPLVIEEMFPLKCASDELLTFVERSEAVADGWISFYCGKPASQYDRTTLAGKLTADWLDAFQRAANRRR
jgi:hypothetical protein